MDVYILNPKFEFVEVVDGYESFIWTERFNGYGDFELLLPIEAISLDILMAENFVVIERAQKIMIIEDLHINFTADTGRSIVVSGRSLESILDRRIVWNFTNVEGSVNSMISTIMNQNLINPLDPNRKIDNFTFVESDHPLATSVALGAMQFHGETLYEVIRNICELVEIGFKVVMPEPGVYELHLVPGVNRSWTQNERPVVVFSPEYENLKESEYAQTYRETKTVAAVAGPGNGPERRVVQADWGGSGGIGLARRELFTSAASVSEKDDAGQPIPQANFEAALRNAGLKDLLERRVMTAFEGEAVNQGNYIYGREFSLGDIVHVENGEQMQSSVRVSEYIYSRNQSESTEYPIFTAF